MNYSTLINHNPVIDQLACAILLLCAVLIIGINTLLVFPDFSRQKN